MRGAALLVCVLATASRCQSDYCAPDSPRSGGMRDIMLAYIAPDRWASEDFLPYVAYRDKGAGGEPRDWFYDSFLFLMYAGAPSGGACWRNSRAI